MRGIHSSRIHEFCSQNPDRNRMLSCSHEMSFCIINPNLGQNYVSNANSSADPAGERSTKNHRTYVPLYRLGSFCMPESQNSDEKSLRISVWISGATLMDSVQYYCIPLIIFALKFNYIRVNFAIFSSDVRVTRNGTEQEKYGWSFPRSANCLLRKCSPGLHYDTL